MGDKFTMKIVGVDFNLKFIYFSINRYNGIYIYKFKSIVLQIQGIFFGKIFYKYLQALFITCRL